MDEPAPTEELHEKKAIRAIRIALLIGDRHLGEGKVMRQRTFTYAKGPEKKLNPSAIHKARRPFEPSLTNPIDKIIYLQRMIGNRSVAGTLGGGELPARLRIDKQTGPNRRKIGFAASMAGLHCIQREPDASSKIMRQTQSEFYCHDPAKLSDSELLREIKRIKKGRYRGMCLNKTESEREYREGLELEAEKRGLFTHPTGIAKTRIESRRQYGADFTHTLSISQGGLDVDLQGTEVREELRIDRDDFELPRAQPATWTLGEMAESRKADEFTDSIETGNYAVQQATLTKRFQHIPPVREETQHLSWRRNQNDRWKRFATVKAVFKVAVCKVRRNRFCAVTIDNGVRVEQLYHGESPKQLRK